jgi:uncharacterized RDD family membrane protein YckC
MPWYLAHGREQIGPVEDADFEVLVSTGHVTADTLVWREGMDAWEPYRNVVALAAGERLPQPGYTCSVCRKVFPADDVIELQGTTVCAQCKPIVVQQIEAGVRVAGTMTYAGFWIRVGAKLLDQIFLTIVNFVLQGIVTVLGLMLGETAGILLSVFVSFAMIAIQVAYTTYFLGRFGATLGKMVCGLRVVTAEGEPITYLRAFGRHFADMLSGLTLGIGYIMVAFDDQKRALHDYICNTRVIRT